MDARRIWAVMSESFWILLVAIVALFVFLLALGAYSPGEVLTLTIVMVVLFLLWLGHAVFVSRKADKRDRTARGRRRRPSGS
jgi:membrane protein implicated in regulation of membrane protease activity